MPGTTGLMHHKAEMNTVEPILSKPYHLPYRCRERLKKDIEQMIELGVIRESDSPYSLLIDIVRKKD